MFCNSNFSKIKTYPRQDNQNINKTEPGAQSEQPAPKLPATTHTTATISPKKAGGGKRSPWPDITYAKSRSTLSGLKGRELFVIATPRSDEQPQSPGPPTRSLVGSPPPPPDPCREPMTPTRPRPASTVRSLAAGDRLGPPPCAHRQLLAAAVTTTTTAGHLSGESIDSNWFADDLSELATELAALVHRRPKQSQSLRANQRHNDREPIGKIVADFQRLHRTLAHCTTPQPTPALAISGPVHRLKAQLPGHHRRRRRAGEEVGSSSPGALGRHSTSLPQAFSAIEGPARIATGTPDTVPHQTCNSTNEPHERSKLQAISINETMAGSELSNLDCEQQQQRQAEENPSSQDTQTVFTTGPWRSLVICFRTNDSMVKFTISPLAKYKPHVKIKLLNVASYHANPIPESNEEPLLILWQTFPLRCQAKCCDNELFWCHKQRLRCECSCLHPIIGTCHSTPKQIMAQETLAEGLQNANQSLRRRDNDHHPSCIADARNSVLLCQVAANTITAMTDPMIRYVDSLVGAIPSDSSRMSSSLMVASHWLSCSELTDDNCNCPGGSACVWQQNQRQSMQRLATLGVILARWHHAPEAESRNPMIDVPRSRFHHHSQHGPHYKHFVQSKTSRATFKMEQASGAIRTLQLPNSATFTKRLQRTSSEASGSTTAPQPAQLLGLSFPFVISGQTAKLVNWLELVTTSWAPSRAPMKSNEAPAGAALSCPELANGMPHASYSNPKRTHQSGWRCYTRTSSASFVRTRVGVSPSRLLLLIVQFEAPRRASLELSNFPWLIIGLADNCCCVTSHERLQHQSGKVVSAGRSFGWGVENFDGTVWRGSSFGKCLHFSTFKGTRSKMVPTERTARAYQSVASRASATHPSQQSGPLLFLAGMHPNLNGLVSDSGQYRPPPLLLVLSLLLLQLMTAAAAGPFKVNKLLAHSKKWAPLKSLVQHHHQRERKQTSHAINQTAARTTFEELPPNSLTCLGPGASLQGRQRDEIELRSTMAVIAATAACEKGLHFSSRKVDIISRGETECCYGYEQPPPSDHERARLNPHKIPRGETSERARENALNDTGLRRGTNTNVIGCNQKRQRPGRQQTICNHDECSNMVHFGNTFNLLKTILLLILIAQTTPFGRGGAYSAVSCISANNSRFVSEPGNSMARNPFGGLIGMIGKFDVFPSAHSDNFIMDNNDYNDNLRSAQATQSSSRRDLPAHKGSDGSTRLHLDKRQANETYQTDWQPELRRNEEAEQQGRARSTDYEQMTRFNDHGNGYLSSADANTTIGTQKGVADVEGDDPGGWTNHSTLASSSSTEVTAYKWPVLGLVSFMFIGATGNILVCAAVLRERRLQTATNYFLLSLAVADLLVCVVVMPFGIIDEFYGK